MKVFRAPYFMLALALLGLAVACYDAYSLYNGQQLWCPPPINGCNEVANSPYARIYNLPVGYFGVVYYLYMFCLAALLAYDPFLRGLRLGALILFRHWRRLFDLFLVLAGYLHPCLLRLLFGFCGHNSSVAYRSNLAFQVQVEVRQLPTTAMSASGPKLTCKS
jgi:hypothetical protein